jgi:HK97 gp10 family phage protein
MSSDITVRLQGVEELKRVLARVPDKLRRKGLLKALRVSARLVRDDARLAAPVRQTRKINHRPGTVKRAISIRTSKFARRAGDVGVFVSVRPLRGARQIRLGAAGANNPNDPYYWRFLEFGTRKLTPRPFLRPASRKLPQVAEAFIVSATAEINRLNTGSE